MKIAVVDTETTGLPLHPSAPLNKQPYIIEFAARIISEDGLEDELTFLCDPGIELEAIITKITGLTNEDIAGHPHFGDRLQGVQNFFDRCDGIAAHNLPFDSFLIWCEVRRQGREHKWRWPRVQICTSQSWEPFFGYRPNLKKLYAHIMGRELEQTHRALDDADALANILLETSFVKSITDTKFKDSFGIYVSEDICPD